MTFDDGTMKYLETQSLDILLFDDNAPMTGIERGGQSSGAGQDIEDMIGVCKIPLKDLSKGYGINGDFDILGQHGEPRGTATVKITVVDTSASTLENMERAQRDVEGLQKMSYTPQWESDIIKRIARKLGRLSI